MTSTMPALQPSATQPVAHRANQACRAHWAAALIGKPWVALADGPEAFDCWGLVRWVYRTQLGVELPLIHPDVYSARQLVRLFAHTDEFEHWHQVSAARSPLAYDVIVLGRATRPHHVGLAVAELDGMRVLECIEGSGVLCSRWEDCKRGYGWGTVQVWRRASVPSLPSSQPPGDDAR